MRRGANGTLPDEFRRNICVTFATVVLVARPMDARSVESKLGNRLDIWLQRERESGRFYDRVAILVAVALVAIMIVSYVLLTRPAEPGSLLSAPFSALLLIANLIPAIALMVLYSRRVAMARAEEGGLGSGRLHTRLVALFSVIAAVPIFVALLVFQRQLVRGLTAGAVKG